MIGIHRQEKQIDSIWQSECEWYVVAVRVVCELRVENIVIDLWVQFEFHLPHAASARAMYIHVNGKLPSFEPVLFRILCRQDDARQDAKESEKIMCILMDSMMRLGMNINENRCACNRSELRTLNNFKFNHKIDGTHSAAQSDYYFERKTELW